MITYDEIGVIYDASNYTYDGYGLTSDIVSDSLVVADSTKKSLLRTFIDSLTSNEVVNKLLYRTLTDNVDISDTVNKSLQITTTDNLSISETFKKKFIKNCNGVIKRC